MPRSALWKMGMLGLPAVLWTSCGVFSTSDPDAGVPVGMVRVLASGRTTQLGAESPYADSQDETPRLTASFTYNFSMDKTEVTQGSFARLLGRNPVTDPQFGQDTSDPVYDVSFYDATLYCNARSKSEGRDTVYSYDAVQRDSSGRVYDLPGFTIHYEHAGYRLPTEAEWEYAARGGVQTVFAWGDSLDNAAAAEVAWYAGNSGNVTHAVAGLQPNSFGIYDMLGNVMEWVNDWKGPYAQITVNDFLGAREPDVSQERVVKGGAFSYDIRYLRYSGRSANYPTISSAAVEYVGFRCALGAIPSGQYLEGGAAHAATPAVTLYPLAAQSFFGHPHEKLVFVNATSNSRTLCYADFSEQPVQVHEFLDDSAVFTPVISPDGNWVAYGSIDEGDPRDGSVWVRQLQPGSTRQKLAVATACIPRWWVDSATSDTFLVYATHCEDNLDPSWPSDGTYRVKVSGGVAAGSPELLTQGGYHDGLSDDGNYLATGYRRLRVKNLVSGQTRLLFTGPQNGKPAGDTSQVCNVSVSPMFAQNPDILLLDFGDQATSTVVGRPYGLHEILFRIDSSGVIKQWYYAPSGFTAWQDVEWSNRPEYAVAVGQDQGGNYPSVVAADLGSGVTAVLATGTTLREPGLWIQPGAEIPIGSDSGEIDSLGQYDQPPRDVQQEDFAARMKIFWLQEKNTEVVCLGSSHVRNGIWPPSFTHFKTLNMGFIAGGLLSSYEILTQYVLPHDSALKAVVLEVHPGWMNYPGGDFIWNGNMGQTKGYQYDSTHGFWDDGVPPALDSVMSAFSNIVTPTFEDSLGGIYMAPGGGGGATGWGDIPPVSDPTGDWTVDSTNVIQSIATFRTTAQLLQSHRVHLVLTIFPESPAYRNTPYYGKYGPLWSVGDQVVAEVKSICDGNSYCHFYDAYQDGVNDYADSMGWNDDHLSTPGAMQLSHRLDSLLWQALGPGP